MSHVSTIEMKEKYTIPVLKEMCKDMGWIFNENKKTYRAFPNWIGDTNPPPGFTREEMKKNHGKCSHEIEVPGAGYSIGVVEKNNNLHLFYDYWNGGEGLINAIGKTGGKLKQAYSIANTKRELRRKRSRYRERKTKDGWKEIIIEM